MRIESTSAPWRLQIQPATKTVRLWRRMFEQRPQFIVALEPRRLVALIESSHRDAHNAGAAPLDQSDAAFELAAGFNPVVDHQDPIARGQ